MQLYIYMSGVGGESLWDVADMFGYGVRFQVLTETEEQKDYLLALQYMYGREIQVDVWSEWSRPMPTLQIGDNGMSVGTAHRRLLPVVFTTFVAGSKLRGR